MTDDLAPEAGPQDDTKRKAVMLGAIVMVMLLFGGLYLLWARGRVSEDLADRNVRAQLAIDEFEASQQDTDPAPDDQAPPTAVAIADGPTLAAGEILVVNRVPGDDYGRLAIRHSDGTRTLLDRSCVRVHISGDHGVCLSEKEGLVTSFETTFFEAANMDVEIKSYASALPSRARISPEGTFSAVTAFASGSSYADVGAETTTIVTIDDIDGVTQPQRPSAIVSCGADFTGTWDPANPPLERPFQFVAPAAGDHPSDTAFIKARLYRDINADNCNQDQRC